MERSDRLLAEPAYNSLMMRVLSKLVLVGVLAAPSWAAAEDPSLADVARTTKQEREERRGSGKTVKSFSDSDLKSAGGSAPSPATDPEAAPAANENEEDKGAANAGKTPEKTDEEIRTEKRGEIQQKIDAEHERMRDADRRMASAQAELADITNYTYGAHRAALQKIIDDGKAEKEKAQQAIEDLQEEARRLGVPVSP